MGTIASPAASIARAREAMRPLGFEGATAATQILASQPPPPPPLSPSTFLPMSKEIQEVAIHVGSLRHYLKIGQAILKDGGVGAARQRRIHGGYIEAGKDHGMVVYADGEVEVAKASQALARRSQKVPPRRLLGRTGWLPGKAET